MWPPAEDLVVHREAAAEREFGSRPQLRLADDRWRRSQGRRTRGRRRGRRRRGHQGGQVEPVRLERWQGGQPGVQVLGGLLASLVSNKRDSLDTYDGALVLSTVGSLPIGALFKSDTSFWLIPTIIKLFNRTFRSTFLNPYAWYVTHATN